MPHFFLPSPKFARLVVSLILICVFFSGTSRADGPQSTGDTKPFEFKLSKEVEQVLIPLIDSIREAPLSRVTVEMLSDAVLSGQVINSQEAMFQIAARKPDHYTVYLKEPEQRTRVYCNGKKMTVAMAPDAFFVIEKPQSIQEIVTNLSVPMGPYPEPLLALSLAGADPAISLIAGMKSIKLVDKKPFKGRVPAVHLRGVQADLVQWDLWITEEKPTKPLRMLIDLTPMLKASDQVHVPEGYSQQIRYDFVTWRVTGEVEDHLFSFQPAPNATEYDSFDHYVESLAGATNDHPLLGKPAPAFIAETFGRKPFDSQALENRVVVLDFWATWCAPCLKSLPILKEVTDKYSKAGVVLLAINTGEEVEEVREFLKKERLRMNVVLDPKGSIAEDYAVNNIPQTVILGKDGRIESVHLGYAEREALVRRLQDELDVLTKGGRIGSMDHDSRTVMPETKPQKVSSQNPGKN